jgi:hypothetical protein
MKAKFGPDGVSFAGPSVLSRRHHVRLGPPTRLACSLKDLASRCMPIDISAGGFSILTEVALREGDIHGVTLTLDDLRVVTFAKVIHCRAEGPRQWIAGLKFLNEQHEGATVGDLLERIAPELYSA